MHSPNYNLVKIDESSFKRTPSGLYYEVEGLEYDKYLFDATVVIPKGNEYQKGQKIITNHFAIDSSLIVEGEKLRCVKDEEVVVYYEDGKPKSKNFILAKRVFKEEKALDYVSKKEVPNVFEVTYSPFDFAKEGDEIAIYQDTDYPIAFSEIVALRKEFCTKNITQDKPINNYVEIQPLTEEGYSKEGGVLISNKDHNKGWGLLNGEEVFFIRNASLKLPNGNYMVDRESILLSR